MTATLGAMPATMWAAPPAAEPPAAPFDRAENAAGHGDWQGRGRPGRGERGPGRRLRDGTGPRGRGAGCPEECGPRREYSGGQRQGEGRPFCEDLNDDSNRGRNKFEGRRGRRGDGLRQEYSRRESRASAPSVQVRESATVRGRVTVVAADNSVGVRSDDGRSCWVRLPAELGKRPQVGDQVEATGTWQDDFLISQTLRWP